jgi:TolB-like protein
MTPLVLNLLGGFELRPHDGLRIALSTKTGQALLAYLALTPGQRHSRDKLAALLWEDRPDQQARTSLRQTLAVLRKSLPIDPSWINTEGDWIALESGAFETDVARFDSLAQKGGAESLSEAGGLYKGDLLQGFHLRSQGFAEWLTTERERIHARAVQVLGKLLALQSDGAARTNAIATAQHLLSLDPLNEAGHRALMRLYAAEARQDLALRQYEICRDRLRRELNVAPEPETEALQREILARRTGTRSEAAPPSPGSPAATTAGSQVVRKDRPAIAVLPFVNQSGDPAQSYLSDGITEDIITELSRYRSLLVIARSSSFQFGGPAVDVAAVRRKLGVRYVVEGSVRRIGTNVRVTAQLIDTQSEGHLWAERYDRPAEEIFGVQDEVASAIAATLEGRIAASAAEIVRKKPTKDWDAYDYFLQGREWMYHNKGIEAEQCFARAVALDPNYVHALAWRSLSLTLNYFVDGSRNQAMIELAITSAQIALDLDDADGWSHQAMGCACMKLGQMQLAGQHFDRAYQLNPNDVNIAGDRANWLLFAGRPEEAIRLLDAAMQRDPYPPTWIWEVRGGVLYQLKRYEEAIAAYLKAGPHPWWMPGLLATAYAQLGQTENARKAVATMRKLKPDCVLGTFARLSIHADPRMREHFLDGLRKAGLPE